MTYEEYIDLIDICEYCKKYKDYAYDYGQYPDENWPCPPSKYFRFDAEKITPCEAYEEHRGVYFDEHENAHISCYDDYIRGIDSDTLKKVKGLRQDNPKAFGCFHGRTGTGLKTVLCDNFEVKYRKYLESEHWQKIRKEKYKNAGYKCEMCGSPMNLNVHHITYENLFYEKDSDLVVLCKECHEKLHGIDNKKEEEK